MSSATSGVKRNSPRSGWNWRMTCCRDGIPPLWKTEKDTRRAVEVVRESQERRSYLFVVRESQERRSYLFDHLYRYLAMDGMPGNRF